MVLKGRLAEWPLILAGFLCGLGLLSTERSLLADEWVMAPPGELGIDPGISSRIDEAVRQGDLPNLHAVLLARDGKLTVEHYYDGQDERWGQPLGEVAFGPMVKHDIRSISKSIVGLLYGIALEEGKVPALDRPLLDQFPAYPDLAQDTVRQRMAVEHALTMTLGMEWDETLPYNDARNSEIAMELADDRYRFILDRPMVAEPGERWVYNGGATAILAHLIAEGTGTHLVDFARQRLFHPLGIEDVEWVEGSNGEPAAASGLRLRPRDLAKIGQLVLNQGQWQEHEIVPRHWLEASVNNGVAAEDGLEYGYQWWLGRGRTDGRRWIAGFGNGGQRLVVIPDLDLVIVVLAGNYNQLDAWKVAVKLMADIVLPSVKEG
ncbi:MAG: serine hydrolase domain-containing protein [Geminicoccaceae bacterium]